MTIQEDNRILKEGLDYVEHHGIKGMHWGIHNDKNPGHRPEGVSRSTHREATKDAVEFARAKQFTGEGAGNRRKHIRSLVESKKSKSASYRKAFDSALKLQDVEKHVTKAKRERKRKDVAKNTKQTAGAVARRFTGEQGTKAAFLAAGIAGVAFLNSSRGKSMMRSARSHVNSLVDQRAARKGSAFVADLLKNAAKG